MNSEFWAAFILVQSIQKQEEIHVHFVLRNQASKCLLEVVSRPGVVLDANLDGDALIMTAQNFLDSLISRFRACQLVNIIEIFDCVLAIRSRTSLKNLVQLYSQASSGCQPQRVGHDHSNACNSLVALGSVEVSQQSPNVIFKIAETLRLDAVSVLILKNRVEAGDQCCFFFQYLADQAAQKSFEGLLDTVPSMVEKETHYHEFCLEVTGAKKFRRPCILIQMLHECRLPTGRFSTDSEKTRTFRQPLSEPR